MLHFSWMEWLNIGSILLGLVSWILPIISIVLSFLRGGNKRIDGALLRSFISMCACAVPLCLQMYYNYHLVKEEAWGAIMDTAGAVLLVSVFLLVTTLVLNILSLRVCFARAKRVAQTRPIQA